jgi:hypothetical protein
MALKISQLTPIAAGTLDGTEPVELGIAGDKSAPTGAFLPPGYIDGLRMTWVSGTAITVTSGAAYIPSLGRVVRANAAVAKAGLALTASTWYHVYLYLNAGVPDVELSATAPAAPYNGTARTKTGDTSRRYVGSVMTDGSGNVLNFAMTGHRIFYQEAEGVLRLLSNGTAITETGVSLSTRVPVTSRLAMIRCDNNSTTQYSYLGNTIDSGIGPPTGGITSNRPQQIATIEFPLDSSQALTYWYPGATTNGLYMSVMGFTYER